MKELYPLLLFIIGINISCETGDTSDNEPEAEDLIEIPDEHFRNALLNSNSIDTNGDGVGDRNIDLNNDGKIQRSEGEVIEGLIMDFSVLEVEKMINLEGIENFVNLKYIKIRGLGLSPFPEQEESKTIIHDFTGLKKLEYLELNSIPTSLSDKLDLSGLTNLKEVILINNRPDYGIDPENWTYPDHFMLVNMEGTTSLTSLDITNSFLLLDFCQVPSLKKLNMFYLEGGEPEVFDFHCLTNLEWLDIGENRIKSLILKNNSVLNTFLASDIGDGYQGWANYPHLEYICIDDFAEEFAPIAHLRNEDTVVVTDCEI